MLIDRRRIFAASFCRAVGVGLVGILLSLYFIRGGLDIAQIGILVAVGLAGVAAGTFLVSFWADRIGRKRTLVLLSLLSALGGFGLFFFPGFWGLVPICFLGMVNAMGRERGGAFTLEHAILPQTTDTTHRTKVLAWYTVVVDSGIALGSLSASVPYFLRNSWGMGDLASYQWMFFLYGVLGLLSALLYSGLSPEVESDGHTPWRQVSPESRRVITRLSLLFGMDSLAGGFLPTALITFWFFKRFGVGEEFLAPLFFFGRLFNALSYLIAVALSKRAGLVNTMVFTHMTANLCLIAVAFSPTLVMAVVLFLVWELLVEMDVPTRQSYLMGLVAPAERTIASGVTNLTRQLAWTIAPGFAGFAMKGLALSFPLVFGGSLKIIYDWALFFNFRHLKPPEEQK